MAHRFGCNYTYSAFSQITFWMKCVWKWSWNMYVEFPFRFWIYFFCFARSLAFSAVFGSFTVRWSTVTTDFRSTTTAIIQNIYNTSATSSERERERENIGIYVTCCDIIYLFDRCFPVFRCVLTCRKGGRAWEIKSSSIILCDSVSDF